MAARHRDRLMAKPLRTVLRYLFPVTGTIAGKGDSGFGAGRRGGARKHAGVDFQAANGSPAVAIVGGKVLYVGHNQGYQWNTVVLGDDGNAYRYATHGPLKVTPGERIVAGQPVGLIDRGHLHLEVIPAGSTTLKAMITNPESFISTRWLPGKIALTSDPLEFFGIGKGVSGAAGQTFDSLLRAVSVPRELSAEEALGRPFPPMGIPGQIPPMPRMRPASPAAGPTREDYDRMIIEDFRNVSYEQLPPSWQAELETKLGPVAPEQY